MKKSKGMEGKFCQLIFIWGGPVLNDLLQFYEFPLILQAADNGKSFHPAFTSFWEVRRKAKGKYFYMEIQIILLGMVQVLGKAAEGLGQVVALP